MTIATPEVVGAPSISHVEIIHQVCCIDYDTAICGADVPGVGWTNDPVTCIGCLLIENRPDKCPVRGTCHYPEDA
jgi:hypothetical protein